MCKRCETCSPILSVKSLRVSSWKVTSAWNWLQTFSDLYWHYSYTSNSMITNYSMWYWSRVRTCSTAKKRSERSISARSSMITAFGQTWATGKSVLITCWDWKSKMLLDARNGKSNWTNNMQVTQTSSNVALILRVIRIFSREDSRTSKESFKRKRKSSRLI